MKFTAGRVLIEPRSCGGRTPGRSRSTLDAGKNAVGANCEKAPATGMKKTVSVDFGLELLFGVVAVAVLDLDDAGERGQGGLKWHGDAIIEELGLPLLRPANVTAGDGLSSFPSSVSSLASAANSSDRH